MSDSALFRALDPYSPLLRVDAVLAPPSIFPLFSQFKIFHPSTDCNGRGRVAHGAARRPRALRTGTWVELHTRERDVRLISKLHFVCVWGGCGLYRKARTASARRTRFSSTLLALR
jgi:hypothetical protein